MQYKNVDEVIEQILKVEGGYVDHPNDLGGPTMWGITEAVARKNGHAGPMQELPRHKAKQIYIQDYVIDPGFGKVMRVSMPVATEMVESGVNVGVAWPARWLQEWLNLFNRQGRDYPDIVVDGDIGPATLRTLETFLRIRGERGEQVMVKALNCSQGDRYREITVARMKNEDFIFGWMDNRVTI